ICVAPYCLWIGGISPKTNKETLDQFRATALAAGRPDMAALVRDDFSWYGAIRKAIWETGRGGRLVVAGIGVLALLRMRREWRRSVLATFLACLTTHFLLTVLLPFRHGYLDPRHTLAVIMLLVPFAGLALAFLLQRSRAAGRLVAGRALV